MILAGLTVARDDAPDAARADVHWRTLRYDALPSAVAGGAGTAGIEAVKRSDGIHILHHVARDEVPACSFDVSPDGRRLLCHARRDVSDRDLVSLFGEHILRTILTRRGLLSFHGACLAGPRGAIVVMGDKGRGKSTLSAALAGAGWQLLADDLTRVGPVGGVWHGFAGLRATKLLPAAAQGLGLDHARLQPRWDDPQSRDSDARDHKRVILPERELTADERQARIAALFVLAPRCPRAARAAHRPLPRHEAVAALARHVTRDPVQPNRIPRAIQDALGTVLAAVPVIRLILPDDMAALPDAVATIDALVGAMPQDPPA